MAGITTLNITNARKLPSKTVIIQQKTSSNLTKTAITLVMNQKPSHHPEIWIPLTNAINPTITIIKAMMVANIMDNHFGGTITQTRNVSHLNTQRAIINHHIISSIAKKNCEDFCINYLYDYEHEGGYGYGGENSNENEMVYNDEDKSNYNQEGNYMNSEYQNNDGSNNEDKDGSKSKNNGDNSNEDNSNEDNSNEDNSNEDNSNEDNSNEDNSGQTGEGNSQEPSHDSSSGSSMPKKSPKTTMTSQSEKAAKATKSPTLKSQALKIKSQKQSQSEKLRK